MSDASRTHSLRFRLVAAGGIGVVVAAISAAFVLGAFFERAAGRAFDRRLDGDLDRLIALATVDSDGRVILRREPDDEAYDRVFSGWYWVFGNGDDARHSRSLWDATELDAALAGATGARRYSALPGPRGQALRVASQRIVLPRASGPVVFSVAGDISEIAADVRAFRWFAALAVATIAVLLLIAIVIQVRVGLRPLRRLAQTIARLRGGEDARFDPSQVPAEVVPLTTEINALLDEHGLRVTRARQAAADLAHALKTPLAALALEGDASTVDRTRIAAEVRRMQAAIDRHLAGQRGADTRARTAVAPVANALVALLGRVHAARGLAFDVSATDALRFAGSADDLEEMLGNLLDNACRWARTLVRLHARLVDGRLVIVIDDDGPGLDAEDAAAAMQRGVRLDERQPGSGLGLDITAGIAASYAGTLQLARNPQSGLRATLTLPGDAGV